jgi:nucleoside-diphosphate-sugar epimerase
MKLLVTGANGFIGRAVVGHALAQGHSVKAIVRKAALAHREHPLLEVLAVGDIGRVTNWAAALQDVEAVVHTAARVHVMQDDASAPLEAFRAVNRDGTRQLAVSAARAGVRRLVLVSSIKVNGERASRAAPFRASSTPAPSDPYGISKLEAEQALREVSTRSGLEFVIVRPPLVIGPGVKANFRALLELIARGVPLPLGAVNNARSLVSVWSLAELLVACAVDARAAGHVFLAADSPALSTREMVAQLRRALGSKSALVPVPTVLLRLAGQLTGRSAQIARLCDSLVVDASDTREKLGFQPSLSLDEALSRTAQWFTGQRHQVGSREMVEWYSPLQ